MANDPGWGNRNDGGPPDLDEIFKNFSKKLNELLGNKGGANSSPSPGSDLPVMGIFSNCCAYFVSVDSHRLLYCRSRLSWRSVALW